MPANCGVEYCLRRNPSECRRFWRTCELTYLLQFEARRFI
uniref:Uncharacterized protein n=1 Tax=Rhizophora mucronata TaxID=61149 RepID=A0A2P2JIU4_RHIMU